MIWTSPNWMPQEVPLPTDTTLGDFTLDVNGASSDQIDKPILISAHDGRSFTKAELRARVDNLARRLSDLLGWSADAPKTPWDKVVALFAVNSVSHGPISLDKAIAASGCNCIADCRVNLIRLIILPSAGQSTASAASVCFFTLRALLKKSAPILHECNARHVLLQRRCYQLSSRPCKTMHRCQTRHT